MYLGIDIGGTTGRVSAFHTLSDTNEFDRVQFNVTQNPNGDFETDYDMLMDACVALAERHSAQSIDGIGLALAGKVSADRTHLTAAGNLGHWARRPVVDLLSDIFICPVRLGNDAEAAALAEAHYGNGKDSDFWSFIWGTGVGGCLVRQVGGKPVAFPGELGHQQVSRAGRHQCGCGQFDCLEAYCGGAGIAKRYGKPAEELTALQWEEVVAWMQVGVRNMVTAQPVPRVVFGGGVASKQSHLLEKLQVGLKEELQIVEAPEIMLSAFGESAGTVGALALLNL